MPRFAGPIRSTFSGVHRCAGVLLTGWALVMALGGCATTLPDPPSDHIDRLPFTLVVPLTGAQAPETEGGTVHAVRWTVRSCPSSDGTARHMVIGSRGTTSASQLPPGALAGLIVCDASNGAWAARKVNVHQGDGVDHYRYEPMEAPFVVLQDNTLEILGFEPGTLVIEAQPESTTGPVGPVHRFDVTIADGTDWRQKVSDALAKMREDAQNSSSSTSSSDSSGNQPFAPSLLHFQF